MKGVTGFVTVFSAAVTAILGYSEYCEHKKRNSIKYLIEFGNKYTENEEIKSVVNFLENLEDNNMYKSEFLGFDNTYS